jgi:hypothetical protein
MACHTALFLVICKDNPFTGPVFMLKSKAENQQATTA